LASNSEPAPVPELELVLLPGWAWSTFAVSHIDTSTLPLRRDPGIRPGWIAAAVVKRPGTADASSASGHSWIGRTGNGEAGEGCCCWKAKKLFM
jgi:hypothetical protein